MQTLLTSESDPAHRQVAAPPWRTITAGFVAVVVAGLFAFRELLHYDPYGDVAWGNLDAADAAFFSPQAASPDIIFPLAAFMIFNRRRALFDALGSGGASGIGATLLLAGVAIALWAQWTAAVDLLLVGAVLLVLAAGALLGGRSGLGVLARPALFMLLLVPVPAALNNAIVYKLQLLTAESTQAILHALDIPSLVSGDLILTEGRTFKVIESCTGIRSIHTLIMAAVVYAELFERGRRTLLALLLVAPVVALVTNQIRVLTLVFNPYSDIASVHLVQGLAMVVVGTLSLAVVDAVLMRFEWFRKDVLAFGGAERFARRPLLARTLVLLTVLLGLGSAPTWMSRWEPAPDTGPRLSSVPGQFDGWTPQGVKFDEDFLGSTHLEQRIYRKYQRDGVEITLMMGSTPHAQRMASLLSDKTAVPEAGWWVDASERVSWDSDAQTLSEGDDVQMLVVRRRNETPRLVLHWYRGTDSLVAESFREVTAVDRSPFGRSGRAIVVTLATPANDEPRVVRQRLVEMLQSLMPSFEKLGAEPSGGRSGDA